MDRKKMYNDLYWGILFLAISMSFNVVVYGISVKIIGLFMLRRGIKGLYEESSITEFGKCVKFCEMGMIFWLIMIAYNNAIVYLGIPGPVVNVLLYSIGWAVLQALIIMNMFKGIQEYIDDEPFEKYFKLILAAIAVVAVLGCIVVLGVPLASTIRMVCEIAMALWLINLLNKAQMQIMKR